MWQGTLLLLSCVVWLDSWHYKDPPPPHTFCSCSTPVRFSKPCSLTTIFCIQSISRQSQTFFFGKSRPLALANIALLLFGISWDVKLNPGPDSTIQETIYPCGICLEPVTWEKTPFVVTRVNCGITKIAYQCLQRFSHILQILTHLGCALLAKLQIFHRCCLTPLSRIQEMKNTQSLRIP